jgi:predicted enzyme related to lactoylglutathione lyase
LGDLSLNFLLSDEIMSKVTIIIPVDNYDEAEEYYRDVLQFARHDDAFLLPVESLDVSLKLIIIDEESKSNFPPKKRFPIFCYNLEKNFLSYCTKIYENGALIETAFSYPGGYYARVSDPAGNQFEIKCESYEEDDTDIDFSKIPFFFNY